MLLLEEIFTDGEKEIHYLIDREDCRKIVYYRDQAGYYFMSGETPSAYYQTTDAVLSAEYDSFIDGIFIRENTTWTESADTLVKHTEYYFDMHQNPDGTDYIPELFDTIDEAVEAYHNYIDGWMQQLG